jgi:hypothetical protein
MNTYLKLIGYENWRHMFCVLRVWNSLQYINMKLFLCLKLSYHFNNQFVMN